MAVGKNYDGSKVEPRIDAEDKTIRVTREWLKANATEKSDAADALLRAELVSQAICPAIYYFNDTPEVRRILGL